MKPPDIQHKVDHQVWSYSNAFIAILSLIAISIHFILHFAAATPGTVRAIPLLFVLVVGGVPLIFTLIRKIQQREFGADLLGGISIITSVVLGEYLAGSIIVLMLSGGEALESFAVSSASSVLAALAKRMPSIAHRREGSGTLDIPIVDIQVGDTLAIYPHEICPADGIVIDGHSVMDESYLTGEPFRITKTTGSSVISGSVNGESVLTIRATRRASDSRYAKIMEVMRESESTRPQLQRMGDKLGALYTPFALTIALLAWLLTGESIRFLSVLVIATPCPLLLAIPIAVIGSISLCAKRGIIVKSPVALEQITLCNTAIFDKTGTLTYGKPTLSEQLTSAELSADRVLSLVASLERYSKHPLSEAILNAAKANGVALFAATEVSEPAGSGMVGIVDGHQVQITSRRRFIDQRLPGADQLPPIAGGLECIITVDGRYAATLRFRDAPRAESLQFVRHLGPMHNFLKTMIISGDRKEEVRYLADQVGIVEIHAEKSPEEKLRIVQRETALGETLYVGDGINDAPAMMAATVGIAIGQNSDVTAEAASVVIMDNTLQKIDEFMHIGRRMRAIALESAIGGMLLSVVGMGLAAGGYLNPVGGALAQEIIDVVAVMNALRAAFTPRILHDL